MGPKHLMGPTWVPNGLLWPTFWDPHGLPIWVLSYFGLGPSGAISELAQLGSMWVCKGPIWAITKTNSFAPHRSNVGYFMDLFLFFSIVAVLFRGRVKSAILRGHNWVHFAHRL